MPISKINGVNINWQVVGERGPWIALTTGGRRGCDEFLPLATKIAAHGFRVMLHDRRNTGASDVLLTGEDTEELIWARDLHELMRRHAELPAFFGGASSGARTSMLLVLQYPQAVRGLLLMRVTGGPFAAKRLPENYYGRYIRAVREGGMSAIWDVDHWKDLMLLNAHNDQYLRKISADTFIEAMGLWLQTFEAGADLPVMGVSTEELQSIKAPTIIIPGNDKVHSSLSALAAHESMPGSILHRLPVKDEDIPLIPFSGWAPYEAEIAQVFSAFMNKNL